MAGKCEELVTQDVLNPGAVATEVGASKPPDATDDVIDAAADDAALLDFLAAFLVTVVLLWRLVPVPNGADESFGYETDVNVR